MNIFICRGVNESNMKLPESFYSDQEEQFAGGVELAFMSTSYDIDVAIEYAMRGNSSFTLITLLLSSLIIGTTKQCSILEIEFDAGNRGAKVKWVSQYSYEEELLYPPCTYLTCKKVSVDDDGIRRLVVHASVSNARPNLKSIKTVKDHDKIGWFDW